MHAVADLLIPLFTSPRVGIEFAQQAARSALDDYRPENGADYVNAARTLAFSMAALALLGQAFEQDLPIQQKMKLFGRANALNRSADQSERTMMQRRRLQNAAPPVEITPPASEPEPGGIASRIAEAMAVFQAACNVGAENQTTPEPPATPTHVSPTDIPEVNLVPPPIAASAIRFADPSRQNVPLLMTPEQIRRAGRTGHPRVA